MDKASYEKVNVSPDIKANIQYLDKALLSKHEVLMKDNYYPAHWHRSIECSLVCKGEIELWINHQKETIKEGEFIFVNSGQIHKLAPNNPDSAVLLVLLPYEFLKKAIPTIDTILFDLHKDIPQKKRIREIYQSFLAYTQHPQVYDTLMMNAYIYELLYLLMQYFQVDEQSNQEYRNAKKQQHRILDYIEDNYKEELSLAKLAEICHMSEEHFSRTFHENFGMNFKTYLTNYRLYCCHDAVVESDKKMQDIAYEHGFSSVKTFIHAFKESYGMTPLQYRKQHRISRKGN